MLINIEVEICSSANQWFIMLFLIIESENVNHIVVIGGGRRRSDILAGRSLASLSLSLSLQLAGFLVFSLLRLQLLLLLIDLYLKSVVVPENCWHGE